MRILVAGGAGFIGSWLTEKLLSENNEVIVVDNFVTGKASNLSTINKNPKLIMTNHDIRAPIKVDGPLDQIYNLASPASPIDFAKIPIFILETGAIGHKNLLELAKEKNARILFASTSEVYGDPLVHPQVEDYFGNVNCIGLRGCYDEAKRFAEALTIAYKREHGVNACIARIFNTYGPRMRPEDGRVIPNFFTQAIKGEALTIYGNGKQTRSLCYVADLVSGLIALMNSLEDGPINLGNPNELTILELADTINHLVNNKTQHRYLPMPENDPLRRKPNIDKANRSLQWQPNVTLTAGLNETLKWFKYTEAQ